MEYFQVRYDSRVVNYDRRGFIRLATGRFITREHFFVTVVTSMASTVTTARHTRPTSLSLQPESNPLPSVAKSE